MAESSEIPPVENPTNWTAEHFRVTDEAIRILRKSIKTIAHFLTPEEHAELNADLDEMVRLRRNAEARSADLVVGGEFREPRVWKPGDPWRLPDVDTLDDPCEELYPHD